MGRLVRRMQYAPTLLEKEEVSSGKCFLSSQTMGDQSVFLFSTSNRLSDGYPGRGVLHTPHNHSRKGYLIARQTIWGRMQYAPTLPEKDKVSLGGYFLSSRTMVDQYASFFSMSNRLSDRHPGRGVLNTPHIDLTSTSSSLAGRLVGRMQYAPTLSKKDEVFSGKCFLSSQTMGDQSVFHFSMSNRLSDEYPGRGAKAYALCTFIVYPRTLCGAFGRTYAIRPYIVGKR